MLRKLGPKLILSLTILIVAISSVSGYLSFRTQKQQLVGTMILGADQLSRSITSATWHAMLDDDRKAAYEMMRVIADKQGVDRIRMFNREGRLVFSTDAREPAITTTLSDEVCASCHSKGPIPNRPTEDARVRYSTSPDGVKTISMVTPIYNEPSCSNASCHAHQASTKVLGVLDVALRLDPVQKQTSIITLQTILWALIEVGSALRSSSSSRGVLWHLPSRNSLQARKRSARWNSIALSRSRGVARNSMNWWTHSTRCGSGSSSPSPN